jgi:hypothetical protein
VAFSELLLPETKKYLLIHPLSKTPGGVDPHLFVDTHQFVLRYLTDLRSLWGGSADNQLVISIGKTIEAAPRQLAILLNSAPETLIRYHF